MKIAILALAIVVFGILGLVGYFILHTLFRNFPGDGPH